MNILDKALCDFAVGCTAKQPDRIRRPTSTVLRHDESNAIPSAARKRFGALMITIKIDDHAGGAISLTDIPDGRNRIVRKKWL